MSIFVVGATSQIGYFLLARLRQRAQDVVALSRSANRIDDAGVRWLQGEIASAPEMAGMSAVISFGPMDGLAQWLARHQTAPAGRLLATSSMSVLTKANSPVAGEGELVRRLAAGEAALREQCNRLGMEWTILRPTLIYGAARDKSLTPVAHRAARTRVFPLPAGTGYRQPVHADDLAQIMLALLERKLGGGMILQVGGGERLLAADMFRRVQGALPMATLPVPVPGWALSAMARLLPQVKGPVSRLNSDLIADNAPLAELLGFKPRPFKLSPWMLGMGADWEAQLLASVREKA